MVMVFMSLGERLAYEREKRRWSQEYVAGRVGISNAVLSNYERDKRDPDTDTLKRLANLYGVSTDYLLGNEADKGEKSRKAAIIDRIKTEFPDADLMFHDLASMTADDLEEVYEFIKFKKSQKDKEDD